MKIELSTASQSTMTTSQSIHRASLFSGTLDRFQSGGRDCPITPKGSGDSSGGGGGGIGDVVGRDHFTYSHNNTTINIIPPDEAPFSKTTATPPLSPSKKQQVLDQQHHSHSAMSTPALKARMAFASTPWPVFQTIGILAVVCLAPYIDYSS
jgi:hypothetical protein